MKVLKIVRNTAVITAFVMAAAVMTGCGGLSEAQIAELNDLRTEVRSLESEANSLKDERTRLTQELAEKNAKLQQCEKEKEQTKVNLGKLPK
jgi:uncharacterized protein YlxW (UPF0749 family)